MDPIFNLDVIKKELDNADPQREFGSDTSVQRVFLGTVFALLPSGKYYMPWACSNVEVCEACMNSFEGPCDENSPCINPNPKPTRNDYIHRVDQSFESALKEWEDYHCEVCRDEAWKQQAAIELDSIGAYLECGEGDPCDLFAERPVEAWIIQCMDPGPEWTDLFWNNETGWGSRETADTFTEDQKEEFNLPDGGVWVPAEGKDAS